ncbi:DNA-binding transcriptional regulator, MarR family [Paracoccus aminovorans]|uniref:DNA-binding transcriptional regulator, MarR family n=1 Tax=Paracoccus aminovorans TaxID=34004 RepID=A0A1I3DT11_9RHOB|nr:MarR family transcriptional regulator [Paracoccus aminovorans]CQR86947.1 MarR family transcriptional regulator [Paracoccus aminovorans]SFH89835.1 DNA-binding transcriptional regulator, MarR family [Paracoccus aminovorans]
MSMENFLPYRLAVGAEAFSRQLFAVYGQKYGLTREEWRLLFLLADAGTIDSVQLAQRTSLDKVQVSRAASRLEDKGLIDRAILGSDRRLRSYGATEAGQALFRQVFDEVSGRADEILCLMSPEDRSALEQGIRALHQAVRQRAAISD